MTADERFALIWAKIERANKHISDLDAAIGAFMATTPYKVEVKRDPKTRKPIYFVADVKAIPQEIRIILGDTIQTLRTALDHLAYQLFLIGTGGSGVGKHVYFPIAADLPEYKKSSPGRVKGLRQDAIKEIDALEPYGGGKGNNLWVLHCLNNVDKHRALVAAGSSFRSVDLLPVMMEQMPDAMKKAFAAAGPTFSLPIKPADNLCPLKVGDELFIGAPDGALNSDVKFGFEVALYEPEIIAAGPMLDIVRSLADMVAKTVTEFKPLLA